MTRVLQYISVNIFWTFRWFILSYNNNAVQIYFASVFLKISGRNMKRTTPLNLLADKYFFDIWVLTVNDDTISSRYHLQNIYSILPVWLFHMDILRLSHKPIHTPEHISINNFHTQKINIWFTSFAHLVIYRLKFSTVDSCNYLIKKLLLYILNFSHCMYTLINNETYQTLLCSIFTLAIVIRNDKNTLSVT